MLIEKMDKDIRDKLVDRYYGYEIVELLSISTEEVIDAFEDEILDKLDEILIDAGIKEEDE